MFIGQGTKKGREVMRKGEEGEMVSIAWGKGTSE